MIGGGISSTGVISSCFLSQVREVCLRNMCMNVTNPPCMFYSVQAVGVHLRSNALAGVCIHASFIWPHSSAIARVWSLIVCLKLLHTCTVPLCESAAFYSARDKSTVV